MPSPSLSMVHVDSALTDLSVAYRQDAAAFVAERMFPNVPVTFKSDVYYRYGQADFRRNAAKERGPSTRAPGGALSLDTGSYNCKVYSYRKDVDDQVRANQDAGIDSDRDAAELVTQTLLIQKELKWVNTYFKTGVWGTDKTGGSDFTKWSDQASSDPFEDVKLGRLQILKQTGRKPNKLLLGPEVFEYLKVHPLVLERIKYTSAESVTTALLAKMFEVAEVMVGEASYATSEEGATAAFSFALGKHALLCYAAPSPSLLAPSAGYTFNWKGYTKLNDMGMVMRQYRIEEIRSDVFEGDLAYDMAVVATDCGYFFNTAVD